MENYLDEQGRVDCCSSSTLVSCDGYWVSWKVYVKGTDGPKLTGSLLTHLFTAVNWQACFLVCFYLLIVMCGQYYDPLSCWYLYPGKHQ